MHSDTLIETSRLRIRHLTLSDAAFVFELVNTPNFVRYIGDKQVRTLQDAERYLTDGPLASYARNGFGLYLAVDRDTGTPMGFCGLVKRDSLDHPDLGYAFRPAYWGRGYAMEAARAVLGYARQTLGIGFLLAITTPDNASSMKLLQRLSFSEDGLKELTPGDTVRVFSLELA